MSKFKDWIISASLYLFPIIIILILANGILQGCESISSSKKINAADQYDKGYELGYAEGYNDGHDEAEEEFSKSFKDTYYYESAYEDGWNAALEEYNIK